MNSFEKYLLQHEYNKLAKLGDRIVKVDELID